MVYRGTSVRKRSAAVQGLVKVAVNETGGSELEDHQGIGRSTPHLNGKVERAQRTALEEILVRGRTEEEPAR